MQPLTIRPWFLIAAGIVLVGLTILIIMLIGGSRRPSNEDYRKQAELTEKALSIIERQQTDNSNMREQRLDEMNAALNRVDSVLNIVATNKPKYITINKGYEEIPNNIRDIADDDQRIRDAFANY